MMLWYNKYVFLFKTTVTDKVKKFNQKKYLPFELIPSKLVPIGLLDCALQLSMVQGKVEYWHYLYHDKDWDVR